MVALGNDVSLDFHETDGEIAFQHYAYLVGEDEFDQVFERIRLQGLEYWADPGQRSAGRINTNQTVTFQMKSEL